MSDLRIIQRQSKNGVFPGVSINTHRPCLCSLQLMAKKNRASVYPALYFFAWTRGESNPCPKTNSRLFYTFILSSYLGNKITDKLCIPGFAIVLMLLLGNLLYSMQPLLLNPHEYSGVIVRAYHPKVRPHLRCSQCVTVVSDYSLVSDLRGVHHPRRASSAS